VNLLANDGKDESDVIKAATEALAYFTPIHLLEPDNRV
jgi:hypothetical protein